MSLNSATKDELQPQDEPTSCWAAVPKKTDSQKEPEWSLLFLRLGDKPIYLTMFRVKL